jgi:two-component system LytT family response regulator
MPTDAIARRIRAVVVDDEPSAREVVLTLLAEHPSVEVVGEATNGREAVELIRRLRPGLPFLDVQMPDLDGFAVLDALGADVPRGVVFVTAHDEHAIRAFEVHALDYVLKPFGRPRFGAAVARALDRLQAMDALSLQQTLASIAADRGVTVSTLRSQLKSIFGKLGVSRQAELAARVSEL